MPTYFGKIIELANKSGDRFLLTITDETGSVIATFPEATREEAETWRTEILRTLEVAGRLSRT
jgi:hypothetical protein